jgi:hypothetical protein
VLLAWILWSQFFGKVQTSWIPHEGFDTKSECKTARDEREARLVQQNQFDGQYVLVCFPDTFDPPQMSVKRSLVISHRVSSAIFAVYNK